MIITILPSAWCSAVEPMTTMYWQLCMQACSQVGYGWASHCHLHTVHLLYICNMTCMEFWLICSYMLPLTCNHTPHVVNIYLGQRTRCHVLGPCYHLLLPTQIWKAKALAWRCCTHLLLSKLAPGVEFVWYVSSFQLVVSFLFCRCLRVAKYSNIRLHRSFSDCDSVDSPPPPYTTARGNKFPLPSIYFLLNLYLRTHLNPDWTL